MSFAARVLPLVALFFASLFVGWAAAQDQPRFTVMGVVIRQEGSAVAWIGEPTYTQNKLVRVREGDQVGPYRVAKIGEDRVELTGPSGPVVVRLSATAPDMPQQAVGRAVPSGPQQGTPEQSVGSAAPAVSDMPRAVLTPPASPRQPAGRTAPDSSSASTSGLVSPLTLPGGKTTSDPKEIRAHFEALKAQKNVPPSKAFDMLQGK